jgi:hypothetical protein
VGQQCPLPKVAIPKILGTNDLVNVVCGDDSAETFLSQTVRDGIDLKFDGSSDLSITIQYSQYAYTRTNLQGCDPLLSSLICQCDPYACDPNLGVERGRVVEENSNMLLGSEFTNVDGRLYRVTIMHMTHIVATCFYPRKDNDLIGCEKSFDMQLAKELIERRLNG